MVDEKKTYPTYHPKQEVYPTEKKEEYPTKEYPSVKKEDYPSKVYAN